jgi:hypothetical protein
MGETRRKQSDRPARVRTPSKVKDCRRAGVRDILVSEAPLASHLMGQPTLPTAAILTRKFVPKLT